MDWIECKVPGLPRWINARYVKEVRVFIIRPPDLEVEPSYHVVAVTEQETFTVQSYDSQDRAVEAARDLCRSAGALVQLHDNVGWVRT